MRKFSFIVLLVLLFSFFIDSSNADDWPQWRHDAARSGASDEQLSDEMNHLWTISLGRPSPAYEHQYRMCADFTYAPVAADGMLFVPSNVTDQVMAFNLETGELTWRYITDGPVRFAPVYHNGKLSFVSDDGYLYCVDAKTGELRWKRCGVPEELSDMRMLVNGRLVSRWPARGAPVFTHGTIYFGAGIWPEEGVYQNAVNAESGKLIWQTDALSIIKEGMCDHGTNHDLSLPPHGYSAVIHDKLAVTSGRTLAAWFDLQTGEMDPYTCFYVKFSVPRGTWYVAGNDNFWSQGGNIFAAHSEAAPPKIGQMQDAVSPLIWSRKSPQNAEFVLENRPFLVGDKPNGLISGDGYENLYSEPIFNEDVMYASVYDQKANYMIPRGRTFVQFRPFDKIVARDLLNPIWRTDGLGVNSANKEPAQIASLEFPILWEMETSLRAIIKSGNHLIAGEEDRIVAIAIPQDDEEPRITWEAKIQGNPVNVLASDEKLVVVSDEGTIHCFGVGEESRPVIDIIETQEVSPENSFALVLGWGDGKHILELANDPSYRVVVLENKPEIVDSAQKTLAEQGLYGARAQVLLVNEEVEITPYWASLVIMNDPIVLGGLEQTLSVAVNALRPFSGEMTLNSKVDQKLLASLIEEKLDYEIESTIIRRISAPEGTADWTHESAGADNSFVSKDRLVRWPLGVLWFSGDIDRFFTPEAHYQHERHPYPLIKGGRMFIITLNRLHAVDIYTGSYLWEAEMPLTPYLQTRHLDNRLYGRAIERNCVLADDLIYCVAGKTVYGFDVAKGEEKIVFSLPQEFQEENRDGANAFTSSIYPDTGERLTLRPVPLWTEIRLWNDLLIAQNGKRLFAVDRHTGEMRWSRLSTLEYTTYALSDDTLYGLDCVPDSYFDVEARSIKTGLLFAMNPATGEPCWSREFQYDSWPEMTTPGARQWMKPPMPFLGYNAAHDLLIIAYNGNNIVACDAETGTELWSLMNPDMEDDPRIYSPNILDDYLMLSLSKYSGGMGYFVDILTGEKLQETPEIPKARTCGRLIGNNHILTYRDAATEIYDVDSGLTIPFNSMRAGCTTSFIPAGGVMSAPMLGHGCVCNYPMFASLALYHMPESDAVRPVTVRQSWGADQ